MTAQCNNTSVGILVSRSGELLLIERRKPPYGWAPPAGHVDAGETYRQAAERELSEEVGLQAAHLELVLSTTYPNRCRRPGGDWHHWEVYQATVTGEPVRNHDETASMRWHDHSALTELAALTRQHLTAGATPTQWQGTPGLEPVWFQMLATLGMIHIKGQEQ